MGRASRTPFVPFALATLACLAGVACSSECPATCLDYAETRYDGSYSLVGKSGVVLTGQGAGIAMVTVDDYDPFTNQKCPSGEDFLVHVDGCVLHARSLDDRHDTGRGANGAFLSATANVLGDLAFGCTLATAGKAAKVNVVSGTITLLPNAISLGFAGTLVDASGAPGDLVTFHLDGTLR
jgi:hypothetical protein